MENIDSEKFFKDLGSKLAKYRKEQNLTQKDLAQKLGVTQQLIAAYEKGIRYLPILNLFKIASILHIGADELLGLKVKAKPGPEPKLLKMLEQIQHLPTSKQKLVTEFIESFIQQHTKQAS